MFSLISNAYAQGEAAKPASGGWEMFILPVMILLIFYFLLIRPSQKKEKLRKKMIDEIQKGDKVLTTGGIYGTVVNLKPEEGIVVLKIGDNTKVEFAKSAVQAKIS